MIARRAPAVLTLLLAAIVGCAGGGVPRPPAGVRTIGSHPGYSIRYVEATPAPLTTLASGQRVVFSVTVDYRLDGAPRGELGLVIQDDGGRPLTHGRPNVKQLVQRGLGRATLTDSVNVPPWAREIQVFVPLFPEGENSSSGELLIRYPVR